MAKKSAPKEAAETLKPGDAKPAKKAKPKADKVNEDLLAILPAPAFQRIAALPVGGHLEAVRDGQKALIVVRGAPLLYAAHLFDKWPSDKPREDVRAIAEHCRAGKGGDVFTLADLKGRLH